MKLIQTLFFVSAYAILPLSASATIYTLNAVCQGFYTDSGFASTPGIGINPGYLPNYFAGRGAGDVIRNVFVFDLTSLPQGTVVSATLSLYNPGSSSGLGNGFGSPNASETYRVGSVSTPISSIIQGSGGSAAFVDFGAGTSWGSRMVSSADNEAYVNITLNSAFGSAAESLLGLDRIAVAGHLDGDLSWPGLADHYIFGFTGNPVDNFNLPHLILSITPVPEPSAFAIMLSGMVAWWVRKNRLPRG